MKRVLVAPLDWGLGHTARCIPLINELQKQNAEVVFAGNKDQIKFVEAHVKRIRSIVLFGYDVHYSAIWPQWMKVGFQSLRLKKIIDREHEWLNALLDKEKFDVIISDNRFGLYTKKAKTIFITHQLNIPSPIFKHQVNNINQSFVEHFDECWIPDDPEIKLSGELCKSKLSTIYIGLLSRFSAFENSKQEDIYDVTFLLSGTEPQRSILEKKLLKLFKDSSLRIALVRGVDEDENPIVKNIDVFGRLDAEQLSSIISKSNCIVCRSGYSSLMDLAMFRKPLFLIPTPGQPEQEYLAVYMSAMYQIPYCEQGELEESEILLRSRYKPINNSNRNSNLLQKEITRILTE